MYYKRVNRGLSFTKSGLYMFGFVLLIGMLAVITGVNGFYLILCSMLGVFVVSGVLSERALKDSNANILLPDLVPAGELALATLEISNSGWVPIYGLENLVLEKYPSYRLIKARVPNLAKKVADIMPRSNVVFRVPIGPIKRGAYREIILLQQTIFPFGLLEKYKFKRVAVNMLVYPSTNIDFLHQNSILKNYKRQSAHGGAEFAGHERFDQKNWKRLDWRKNVNKKDEDWVVKKYEDEVESAKSVLIKAPFVIAERSLDEISYETYLQNIASTIIYLVESGFKPVLSFGSQSVIFEFRDQLIFLAKLPEFSRRIEYSGTDVRPLPRNISSKLIFSRFNTIEVDTGVDIT